MEACPAGVDVPRYIRFIVAGQYAEALAVVRESIPFPAVCGYVCPAPCEIKCQLAQIADAPEAIRTLKRFVADHASRTWRQNHEIPPTGKSVAIVGSGPAGLTAAYYLAKQGHRLTVFEALPQLGGMMRVGIPSYRLPRDILDAEIEDIEKAGIEVKTSTRIESLDSLLAQGYDAAFIAIGAHQGVRMGIDGEDSPGVIDALSFLRQVNLGKCPTVGKIVAVVGGGNSAVDASRTALRLGAKEVTIVYRRTRAEMRAYPEEVNQAIQRRGEYHFSGHSQPDNCRRRSPQDGVSAHQSGQQSHRWSSPTGYRQRIYRRRGAIDCGRWSRAGDSPGVFIVTEGKDYSDFPR